MSKRPDDLLTAEEAAELLGLKPTLVRSMAARDLLPASRAAAVGSDWRFSKQQLLEHAAARGAPPPAPIVESSPPVIAAARPRSRILTVEQAAELLQVRPKTVRSFAHKRKIPAVKIGKLWRFDEDLLLEWLARQAQANEALAAPPSPAVPTQLRGIRIKPEAGSLSERMDQILQAAPEPSPRKSRPKPH
jgi:excisionase family DNA binding protein